jgi:DNA-binding PadR family transcriptional regulator
MPRKRQTSGTAEAQPLTLVHARVGALLGDSPGRTALRDGKVSIRHAILGYLALEPRSGYDLKRAFDQTLGLAWNAYDSQIYTELRRLEADGFVAGSDAGGGRRRRVYSLTETGQEELDGWLASPTHTSFTRDEFLLRLFFFHRLAPPQQADLLRAEIARLTDDIDMTARQLQPFEGRAAATRPDHPLRWQLASAHVTDAMNRIRCAELRRLLTEIEASTPNGRRT